jgi:hypothetical protein
MSRDYRLYLDDMQEAIAKHQAGCPKTTRLDCVE